MFGGNDGGAWDDGTHDGVKKISVVHGPCIYSIQVVYGDKGRRDIVEAEKHGSGGTTATAETSFELQYPREFLERVSGHYGPVVVGGSPVIRSLTFKSNMRTHGPYGMETGTKFSSPEGAKILGFKGRSNRNLNAIGFHLSTVPERTFKGMKGY